MGSFRIRVSEVVPKKVYKELQFSESSAPQAVWTPAPGKSVKLKRFTITVDSDARIDLQWGYTAFESYWMTASSSIVSNLIHCNIQGPVNTPLTLSASAACTVKISAYGEEV